METEAKQRPKQNWKNQKWKYINKLFIFHVSNSFIYIYIYILNFGSSSKDFLCQSIVCANLVIRKCLKIVLEQSRQFL